MKWTREKCGRYDLQKLKLFPNLGFLDFILLRHVVTTLPHCCTWKKCFCSMWPISEVFLIKIAAWISEKGFLTSYFWWTDDGWNQKGEKWGKRRHLYLSRVSDCLIMFGKVASQFQKKCNQTHEQTEWVFQHLVMKVPYGWL